MDTDEAGVRYCRTRRELSLLSSRNATIGDEQGVIGDIAARAGAVAGEGARPLSKNAYKVPLTKGVAEKNLVDRVQRGNV